MRGGALGSLNILLGLDTVQFTSALSKTDYQSQQFARRFSRNMQSIDASAQRAANAIAGIKTSLGAVTGLAAGAFSVRKLVDYADTWTGVGNQIRYASGSAAQYAQSQKQVLEIADRTRSAIAGVTSVFTKVTEAQEMMKVSGSQIPRITETISKSLILYARSSQEAASAQLQLGQAIGSGKLQGDEYKSLRESASGFVTQLAKAMEVSRAQLDQMATKGEITSERLGKALLKMSGDTDRAFAALKPTIGQAMTVVENELLKFIGHASDATKASENLAGGIMVLARNMDLLLTAAGTFGGLKFAQGIGAWGQRTLANVAATKASAAAIRDEAVASAQALAFKVQNARFNADQLKGIERIVAIEKTVIPLQKEHAAAVRAATVATQVYNRASGLLSRGLALIGGPVGLLTIAVTGGVYAWNKHQASVEKNKQALLGLGDSLDDILKKYKELNKERQAETLRDAKSGLETQTKAYRDSLKALERHVRASGANDWGFGGWGTLENAQKLFNEATMYLDDLGMSSDEVRAKVIGLVEAFAKQEGITEKSKEAILTYLDASIKQRREMIKQGNAVAWVQGKALNLVDTVKTLTGATRELIGPTEEAIKKYTELTKSLQEAVATFGMTEAQLTRYKAQMLGVSDEQVQYAEALAETKAQFAALEKATAEGNEKAAAAAKKELALLSEKTSKLLTHITLVQKLGALVSGSGTLSEKLGGIGALMGALAAGNAGHGGGAAGGAMVTDRQNELQVLQALIRAGIDDRKVLSALMGQLAHESGGFKRLLEIGSGAKYEGRKSLGNTEPGDGERYKGRGFVQLTGRDNYARIGKLIGQDLVNNPELASDPRIAADVAVAFLKNQRGVMAAARDGNIDQLTQRINGGDTGLADRKRRTAEYESGRLETLLGQMRAEEKGQAQREKALAATRLANIGKVAQAQVQAVQTELQMLELRNDKDESYYSRKLVLTQKAADIQLAAIDKEIAAQQALGTDAGAQKAFELSLERNQLLDETRVKLAQIKKEHVDIGVAAQKAISDAQASAKLYLDTLKQADQRLLDAFGLGDRARGLVQRKNQASDDYVNRLRELDNSYSGKKRDAGYTSQADALRQSYEGALKQADWYYGEEAQRRESWQLGFKEGLANVADEAGNVYSSVSQAVANAFGGMTDALTSFVKTGKADVKSLADSIIADLLRITIQRNITGPLATAIGGLFGGGTDYGFGNIAPLGGWDTGGYTGHGGKYEIAGVVHRKEGVLSSEEVMALGGEAGFYALRRAIRTGRGYAQGGIGGQAAGLPAALGNHGMVPVTVNLHNQSGQPLAAKGTGRLDVEGMVVDVVLTDLDHNGPMAQKIQSLQMG